MQTSPILSKLLKLLKGSGASELQQTLVFAVTFRISQHAPDPEIHHQLEAAFAVWVYDVWPQAFVQELIPRLITQGAHWGK